MAEAAEAAQMEAKAGEVAVAEATSGEAESGARAAVALMDKFNELFKEQQTIAAEASDGQRYPYPAGVVCD